ncbi:unnamed protein product [Periconia digitata]|uniref:Uncharacterized protein n=1 Tax=Periconia digitata TaxID=1303443 RepID=A0A9W4UBC9_9PLEO|nr:unnamed protein product [Periconia digitata]
MANTHTYIYTFEGGEIFSSSRDTVLFSIRDQGSITTGKSSDFQLLENRINKDNSCKSTCLSR